MLKQKFIGIYKRLEKIWSKIDILIVYMFIGLSMGETEDLIGKLPKILLFLIYFGGFYAIQMLSRYCKKNELKIFGKMNMDLFGFIIWISSFTISIFSTNLLNS
ncbi:hypothetical protein [Candidatus Clostridium radicumherbarum]|uniref:Uncharacterized protein n=1 Tax=Candidatus Clostridium radicumherbarum TaxID=3381662 RepID=A0ABW8TWQ5_9CLOT